MKHLCCMTIGLLLLATPALAVPPAIDGSAADTLYGAPLVIQDTATGFGDASLGRPDICNGSELDSAYGLIYGDTLYLVLAGNFETNGNWVEIFFDTRAGGQNRLLSTNPGPANAELLRMSDNGLDPNAPGLTFQTGFEADYWVSAHVFGDPAVLAVHYAELYVSAGNPGVYYNCGDGAPVCCWPGPCAATGGTLSAGDPNAPVIKATVDNSNTFGVTGGYGGSDGSFVTTGLELAIPLSALGNPTGAITITAFLNGQQHDYVSNQVLGGLGGLIGTNLIEPRAVNFQTVATGAQTPFTVPAVTTPKGACCISTACSITTQAGCIGNYQGENTNCDGNPCNAVPQGRCCIDDGFAGSCSIREQAQCSGSWGGPGSTCESCPCLLPPTGACCDGYTCSVIREAACLAITGGVYTGNYSNCGSNPCEAGACCNVPDCTEVRRFACVAPASFFAGLACTASPCTGPTIPTPYAAGGMNGWSNNTDLMAETAPGSGVFTRSYTGLTAGARYEWKVTNGTWSGTIPGANSWFFADSAGNITLTYDGRYQNDGWLPARDRLPLPAYSDPGTWTAVGDWQGWNNADPNTAMAAQGGGIYKCEATNIAAGTHAGKATMTGTWDAIGSDNRSVNAGNVAFTVGATTDKVITWVDALQGRVKVDVVAAPLVCRGDVNCDGQVSFKDINPFVLYLSNFSGWQATFTCSPQNGDINQDGTYPSFKDINPFVSLLSSTALPIVCP